MKQQKRIIKENSQPVVATSGNQFGGPKSPPLYWLKHAQKQFKVRDMNAFAGVVPPSHRTLTFKPGSAAASQTHSN